MIPNLSPEKPIQSRLSAKAPDKGPIEAEVQPEDSFASQKPGQTHWLVKAGSKAIIPGVIAAKVFFGDGIAEAQTKIDDPKQPAITNTEKETAKKKRVEKPAAKKLSDVAKEALKIDPLTAKNPGKAKYQLKTILARREAFNKRMQELSKLLGRKLNAKDVIPLMKSGKLKVGIHYTLEPFVDSAANELDYFNTSIKASQTQIDAAQKRYKYNEGVISNRKAKHRKTYGDMNEIKGKVPDAVYQDLLKGQTKDLNEINAMELRHTKHNQTIKGYEKRLKIIKLAHRMLSSRFGLNEPQNHEIAKAAKTELLTLLKQQGIKIFNPKTWKQTNALGLLKITLDEIKHAIQDYDSHVNMAKKLPVKPTAQNN